MSSLKIGQNIYEQIFMDKGMVKILDKGTEFCG
jgi:hypothetical protein